MAERGRPPAGSGDGAESPLPAGYGSLDAGFPAADPAPPRRRPSRADPGASGDAERPSPSPMRPWARRALRPPAASPAFPASSTQPGVPLPTGVPLPGPPPTGRSTTASVPPDPPGRLGGVALSYSDADVVEGPVRGRRHPHQKVRVVRGVRSKRLIRRVDVWTVFKVSFIFYLLALVALVVAGVIVWNAASAFGFIHTIEKSVRTLFSLKTFTLHPRTALAYGSGIGALLCVVGVVVNVLAAVAYNLISDLVGGIQVVVVSEPG